MNIMLKITLRDGISYLVKPGEDAIFIGETIRFEDYVLGAQKIDTKDIRFISIVQQ